GKEQSGSGRGSGSGYPDDDLFPDGRREERRGTDADPFAGQEMETIEQKLSRDPRWQKIKQKLSNTYKK
ncbi:MAG: hypothetical protein J5595_05180, partial [Bacteroidales bacterium]|nr:hypothetical protein [Bacteroidales bacterium]